MFEGLEKFKVATSFLGGPAENEGQIVDEARFAEFLQGFFMVLNVDHCQ